MKNRLILTLTTSRGSRQLSLNMVARIVMSLFVLMLLASFFISNALLVKRSDELNSLTADHRQLANLYTDVLDSRDSVTTELDQLNTHLSEIQQERDEWSEPFRSLEQAMGLDATETMTIERSHELQEMAYERLFMLHGIPNGRPVEGIPVTDKFGLRKHPVAGKRKHHNGIDFLANTGTPIYATADGAVEYSGFHKKSGYGNLIIINHNFGFKTYFAHLKRVKVRSGQLVKKGELIGYSGNSGVSTGPHLHYEVRFLYKPLDPMPFLNWSMDNYEPIFEQEKGVKWSTIKAMALRTFPVLGSETSL